MHLISCFCRTEDKQFFSTTFWCGSAALHHRTAPSSETTSGLRPVALETSATSESSTALPDHWWVTAPPAVWNTILHKLLRPFLYGFNIIGKCYCYESMASGEPVVSSHSRCIWEGLHQAPPTGQRLHFIMINISLILNTNSQELEYCQNNLDWSDIDINVYRREIYVYVVDFYLFVDALT